MRSRTGRRSDATGFVAAKRSFAYLVFQELRIQNFALIDDITVQFKEGFTVITGETGAGKSVLINAISILLGQKTNENIIRSGAVNARIDGVFQTNSLNNAVYELLKSIGIELQKDEENLIISREIHKNGRTVSRINSVPCPINSVKKLSEYLIDLHGQYQHQSLLRESDHSIFIDALGDKQHQEIKETVKNLFLKLKNLKTKIKKLKDLHTQRKNDYELLSHRIEELKNILLPPAEYEELQEEYNTLLNSQKLKEVLQNTIYEIAREGSANSAILKLNSALKGLKSILGINKEIDVVFEEMENAEIILTEATKKLRNLFETIASNSYKLKSIEDKLADIEDIMRKCKCKTMEELLDYKTNCEKKLSEITVNTEELQNAEKELPLLQKQLFEAAKFLSEKRQTISRRLEKVMIKELAELEMKGCKLKIKFLPITDGESAFPAAVHPSANVGAGSKPALPAPADSTDNKDTITACQVASNGLETIEFWISTNPGEPAKPLSQIASGGEISRIMLAFKTILGKADEIKTLVFDEIDTGIGGITAYSLAKKMLKLALSKQVISITHLPQIASCAGIHFFLSKVSKDERTVIQVEELENGKRIEEIARMTGNIKRDDAAKKFAKEILKEAENIKTQILKEAETIEK